MDNEKEEAYFFQRVLAFVVDMIIVSIIAGLLATPFVKTSTVDKLTNDMSEISNKYVDGQISTTVYMNQTMDISYEFARANGGSTIVELLVLILYFIVFQFYNKCRTVGKMLMRIKVVNEDGSDAGMNNIIVRSLIIDFILVNMIIFAFVIFANKDIYLYAITVFESIQYLVLIISAFMIMFGVSGKGIHDKIAHTKVIRAN